MVMLVTGWEDVLGQGGLTLPWSMEARSRQSPCLRREVLISGTWARVLPPWHFGLKKKKKSQLDREGQRKYKMKRGLWIPRILSVRSKQSLFKEKEGKHRTNSHEDHSWAETGLNPNQGTPSIWPAEFQICYLLVTLVKTPFLPLFEQKRW